MRDGSPQVTPVWVDHDGEHILVNTAEGRVKHRNIVRDSRVALEVMDIENPYSWFQVRGKVVEVTRKGADAHINKMSRKYTGRETYVPVASGEKRIIVRIKPKHITVR